MEDFYLLAGAVSLVAFAYSAILYQRNSDQKHQHDVQAFAFDRGFHFSPVDNGAVIQKLSHYSVFEEGRNHQVKNIVAGSISGGVFFHFDHSYWLMQTKILQTAMILESAEKNIPSFKLRFEQAPGYEHQGLRFSQYPIFSSSYCLTGGDHAKLRRVFQPALLELFEEKLGLCAEGGGNQILIYREYSRVEAKEIPGWLEFCASVFFHLTQTQSIQG